MGAVLAANAAEKVASLNDGDQGDVFFDNAVSGSTQISDKEGAGILDARWAWGILANNNYWNIIQNGSQFPYTKTVTIDTNVNNLTRIAIFWTKNNTNINHSDNTLGTHQPLTNFNLRVFDAQGNEVCWSTTAYSNFEIVQFEPTGSGEYTIRIEIVGTSNATEYVGLAIW